MFINKEVGLWLARKTLYAIGGTIFLLGGTFLISLAPQIAAGTLPSFKSLTMIGFLGGLGAAIFRDLKVKVVPDFLQIITGQDPRSDG